MSVIKINKNIITEDMQLTEFLKAVKNFKKSAIGVIEYNKVRAQIARNFYNDLISQGFTKDQALKITTEKLI